MEKLIILHDRDAKEINNLKNDIIFYNTLLETAKVEKTN
jgi:hypothetical protein